MAKGTIPQAKSAGLVIRNLGAIEQWIIGSAEVLHGLSAPKSSRTAIPGAMFVLGVQYQHSIAILCREGLFAGAFALLRPLVEAMFRGAWLRYAATDQQLSDFADGKYVPDRKKIDGDLRGVKRFREFREYLDHIYGRALHDFSHGGHQQMWSRINDGTIGEGHNEENVNNLVHATAVLGHICSMEIASSCDSLSHAQRLKDLFRSLFPHRGDLDNLAKETVETP